MCSEPCCPDVGLMVIGDDGRRLGLGGRPGAAEELLGGGQVPSLAKQYVDHLAVLIDSAVEVPLGGAMEEEDLVDVPASAKPTTMPPGGSRDHPVQGRADQPLARVPIQQRTPVAGVRR